MPVRFWQPLRTLTWGWQACLRGVGSHERALRLQKQGPDGPNLLKQDRCLKSTYSFSSYSEDTDVSLPAYNATPNDATTRDKWGVKLRTWPRSAFEESKAYLVFHILQLRLADPAYCPACINDVIHCM